MRRKVIIHDAAGISRLCLRLFFYLKMPRIEVRIEKLPDLVVQYAQHRITRLSEARNTLLGEVFAIVALLCGSYVVWWMARGWQLLGLVAAIAMGAWVAGKLVNVVWTRLRLLGVLLRLRLKLAVVSKGNVGAIGRQVIAEPRRYQGRRPWKLFRVFQRFRRSSAAKVSQELPATNLRQPVRPRKTARPRVSLRQITDIDRLMLKVISRWKLPRVEILVDAVPLLDKQRAQLRFVRLSEASNWLLGGVLGAAALVGASFYLIWIPDPTLVWARTLGWHSLAWVLALGCCAALIGAVIEFVWTRTQLVLMLLRLRRRIGSMAVSA